MSELPFNQPTDRGAVLNAVVQAIGESSDLETALETALQCLLDRVLREVLGLEAGWLMLRDEAGAVFRTIAWHGVTPDALENWQAVDVKAQRGHLAAQMGAPLLADDPDGCAIARRRSISLP